jgi:hypothetical protein
VRFATNPGSDPRETLDQPDAYEVAGIDAALLNV